MSKQQDGQNLHPSYPKVQTSQLRSVVLKPGQFCPQETLGNVWRHFGLSLLGGGVCYKQLVGGGWTSVAYPIVPGTAPTMEKEPTPSVAGVAGEEPQLRQAQDSSLS